MYFRLEHKSHVKLSNYKARHLTDPEKLPFFTSHGSGFHSGTFFKISSNAYVKNTKIRLLQ